MRDGSTRRFLFHTTPIEGVIEVERRPIADRRGRFARLYCDDEFGGAGLLSDVAQINLASTALRGTVRGMHLQAWTGEGAGEAKFVTCVAGRVLDVALDLRRGSPTFGHHHALELSAEKNLSLLIPPGVAHGMQALEDAVTLLYLHGAPFNPELERGVRADDPELGIPWPLPVVGLSDRDQSLPDLDGLDLT